MATDSVAPIFPNYRSNREPATVNQPNLVPRPKTVATGTPTAHYSNTDPVHSNSMMNVPYLQNRHHTNRQHSRNISAKPTSGYTSISRQQSNYAGPSVVPPPLFLEDLAAVEARQIVDTKFSRLGLQIIHFHLERLRGIAVSEAVVRLLVAELSLELHNETRRMSNNGVMGIRTYETSSACTVLVISKYRRHLVAQSLTVT